MKVLFTVAECVPFVKSGGLADVAGALPKELVKKGIEIAVMIPKYGFIPADFLQRMEKIAECTVQVGWRNQYCGIETLIHDGVTFYFLDNEYYFKRDSLYGHYDDGERFAFFSRAVFEAAKEIGFQPDIIHTHDWHTAMTNYLLKAEYVSSAFFQHTKCIFTIHNLQFQGSFPREVTHDLFGLDMSHFSYDHLELYGLVNYMKAGIISADVITTVSPTYRNEILTDYFGERMNHVLFNREKNLVGILNGIDNMSYNPETDPALVKNFNLNQLEGKQSNKQELQSMFGLPTEKDVPILGIVSRLTKQKGLDLLKRIMHEILELPVQFIVLGTGDQEFEDYFRHLEWAYSNKCRAYIGFDEGIARKIYAGSDMFLMPSKFEPCGLGQLIALRYGSIPIVRETGGLNDTVQSYREDTQTGNGFSFLNFNAHDMKHTIERALYYYHQKEIWQHIVRRAMAEDNSWSRSADLYLKLYTDLIRGSGGDVLY